MYTVTCNYFATGEGITYMVLFTRGYGPADGHTNALETFKRYFGDYYSIGAELQEGMVFDFSGSEMLVSDTLRAKLEEWVSQAGGLEYHAKLHVNFS